MSSRAVQRSAKGLFRATGGAPRPVVTDLIDGEAVWAEDGLPREADDFYPTPPEPVRALVGAERNRLSLHPLLWEPACGDGAMQRALHAEGFATVGSDLIDRGAGGHIADFFSFTRRTRLADAVVTNPPFAPCNVDPGWVRHGWEVLGLSYMALLLPFNWLGSGKARARLWAECRPARVHLMRWRIDWTGQGAPPMLCCWVVWDRRAAPGMVALNMLDRPAATGPALLEAREDA